MEYWTRQSVGDIFVAPNEVDFRNDLISEGLQCYCGFDHYPFFKIRGALIHDAEEGLICMRNCTRILPVIMRTNSYNMEIAISNMSLKAINSRYTAYFVPLRAFYDLKEKVKCLRVVTEEPNGFRLVGNIEVIVEERM